MLSILILGACSKTADDNPEPPGQGQIEETAISNLWRINLFTERGEDETSKFSGYTLAFKEDGSLIVENQSVSFEGTWSTGNGSDDSNSSNRLIINISGNEVVNELQDDWVIEEMNESKIRLYDDSDNHTEILELVKV